MLFVVFFCCSVLLVCSLPSHITYCCVGFVLLLRCCVVFLLKLVCLLFVGGFCLSVSFPSVFGGYCFLCLLSMFVVLIVEFVSIVVVCCFSCLFGRLLLLVLGLMMFVGLLVILFAFVWE